MDSRSVNFVLLCACGLSLLSFGLRAGFGLFMAPISCEYGWGRDVYSVSIAIQNLVWGLGAVVAGTLADRFGNLRVVFGGSVCYAAGLWAMTTVASPMHLHMSAGVMVGAGIAGTAFGILLPAMARAVGPERRQMALGLGTAAGSAGQFLVVPVVQWLLMRTDLNTTLLILAVVALGMIVLAIPLAPYSGSNDQSAGAEAAAQSMPEAVREAAAHRSYWLVVAGFFVCGFQLAFLTAHLPVYLSDNGMDPFVGAMSLSLIGLCNIVGSLLAGRWSSRYSKKYMLAIIYAARAALFAVFLVLPVSMPTVVMFSCLVGLLWLATVPPTSGLVAQMFGTRYMSMLYGVVFLSHQIGSFFGVWLGGVMYESQGNYDMVWMLGIGIAVFSSIIHLPVDERPVARLREASNAA